MKKLIIILFTSFFIVQSCKEEEFISEEFIEQESSNDILNAQIASSLYDVIDLGDKFLIENDILISKDQIKEFYKSVKGKDAEDTYLTKRHFHTDNLINIPTFPVGTTRAVNIFWDRTGFPPDGPFGPTTVNTWGHGLTTALRALNEQVTTRLVFNQVYNENQADIVIRSDNGLLPNNVVAAAGFPSNGNPYDEILINLNFLNNRNLLQGQMSWNLIHEIGHCIGLRHTNLRLRGESQNNANPIPFTINNEDPNSIFNGGTALSSGSSLSFYDKRALTYLYNAITLDNQ